VSFQISQALVVQIIAVSVLIDVAAASPAQAHARTERDRAQRRCMVHLPDVQDASLRRWCLKQSERMP
jgi:hypothetical protein